MCERVGVPVPRITDDLVWDAQRWICARVVAPFIGVPDVLRGLRARGHRLFTSTGQPSVEIAGYLEAMGVRDLFDETYGTDIVDRWKTNAGYYRKLLEHSAVRAEDAVTLDDQERCLDWASRAGFRTFLLAPASTQSTHEVIATLGELSARLDQV
jgi:phosphoglycolate phosphatase-like HAD superfamily hydrolase